MRRLLATRDSLAECVHTSLKNLCDSKETSLLWNLINVYVLTPDTSLVWTQYLDNLWMLLKLVNFDTLTPQQALVLAAENLEHGRYNTNTLRLSLELLSVDDLTGMAGYLYEQYK